MSVEPEPQTRDELRRLVVEFADSGSAEDDERIMGAIRELAYADCRGFVDALLGLDTIAERSDALESLVYVDPFDPSFEPIIEAYADSLDDVLAANPEPASLTAYQAALGYCVLGELTIERAPVPLVDRLAQRADKLYAHRHPDIRSVALCLLVDFRRPNRYATDDRLLDALTNDPDPVVRNKAYTELSDLGTLPAGAVRPFRPTWFRSIRRYLAGG